MRFIILIFYSDFYSLVILLVSLFSFKRIVKRYWIAIEIALYKQIIIIIITLDANYGRLDRDTC